MAKRSENIYRLGDYNDYQPDILRKNFTQQELNAEYKRLRELAKKRLARIAASEFATSEVYNNYKNRFKGLRDMKPNQVVYALSEVSYFLNLKRASVSGMREERKQFIKTMHERGYDYINDGNYQDYTEFMDWVADSIGDMLYDSDRINEVYEYAQDSDVDPEELKSNFDWYYRNIKKLKDDGE